MKYLAVLLAILSAGSAWGAELVNYVPTGVTVTAEYRREQGKIRHTYYQQYDSFPVTASLNFTDKHDVISIMSDVVVRNEYQGLDNGSFTLSGPNGGTLFLNDKFSITANYDPAYGDRDRIPFTSGSLENAYLPPTGSSYQQQLLIRCGVPMNIRGVSKESQLKLGTHVTLHPPGDLSPSTYLDVYFTCKWHLRAVYSLSLSLEKTVLTIMDKVGSNTIHNTKLRVTGNGGAVVITIDNPMPEDISTSFSDTLTDVLTTTAKPSMEGTTVPFYVVVQNTRAGSRTYNVNFTAAYV